MEKEELQDNLDSYGLSEEDFTCFTCVNGDDCDISFDVFESDCDCILPGKKNK